MRDALTIVVEVSFAAVFVHAAVTYLRGRDAVQRDVMWVFTAMAVIFVLEVWQRLTGPPPPWLSGASTVLLLAQPYLTLRLAARLRQVPRWLRRAALAALVLTATPFLPGRPVPAAVIWAAVGAFVAVECTAAGYLWSEARRRSGSPRMRLRAAALGTLAFAVAIVAAGAGAGDRDAAVGAVALAVAAASAGGYLVAFVPPRWLRRWWSTAAAYAVTRRMLHAPPGEPAERTWQRYADSVCEVTGADAALVVLADSQGRVREVAGARVATREAVRHDPAALAALLTAAQPVTVSDRRAPELAHRLAQRTGACHLTAVALGRAAGATGALVLLNTHRRLFADDDVALLGELGEQAGVLAAHGTLLAEQERLNAELAGSLDALSMASKAKSDFLAAMSHELRTPLSAIIGFSDLMDSSDPVGADDRLVPAEWVRHIRTSGRHLLALINDILDLAKVEAGRIDLKVEALPLAATVTEVVTTLRAVSDRKHLRLLTDLPAVVVRADRIRLRQVLDNLLSNAIKFTGEHGTIRVTAQQTDTEVRITVADTGVGITPEDQKKVFDEFVQVGDPTARQAGTGLGLALTRRLVEAHGGHVELESEPGAGSQFTVCLPRHDHPPAPTHAGRPEPLPAGGVLIVEDDPAAADLLTTQLTGVGYAVTVARTGRQALATAGEQAPGAILLDILLPDADGWEVLRRLKETPATRDIPVIVTTVLDEHHVGAVLGAVDYLAKPVDPQALIAVLTRHALLPAAPATGSVLTLTDDPATRDLVATTLAPLGARTAIATTGRAGLASARRSPPDLIVCDLVLPDSDAIQVTDELHRRPTTARIPVLVVAGDDLSEDDRARLARRAVEVVRKGDAAQRRLRDWLTQRLG